MAFLSFSIFPIPAQEQEAVKLWEESLVVPTYRVAPPDRNPRFYRGRVYQGAKASFYPYPISDRLLDQKEDKAYRAVYLENRYYKLCVLPEIGGRIFSARDKTNGYDFFYRQHVVKPALIGMLGSWISGGVEWNVPHHHRASSFLSVDCTLKENPDGSKTIWVGELELRHRMRWIIGLTAYPDRSYIEMSVKIFNRTPVAHSLLFWINPAVHATPEYQVIFPPSTEYATQHGKPEFASWPVARSVYGGADYTSGVDISWWKNHPKPVSFFAWDCDEDFFGGYDHGKAAGVIHVADHHAVPGKKFFEWGNGPQGEMWTKILTDEDGPYLELMAGAYSDNQPDYSWCQPREVKIFKQYWYPLRDIGGVKNANLQGAVNLDVTENGTAKFGFNTTREFKNARVVLEDGGKVFFQKKLDIAPDRPFTGEVELPDGQRKEDLRVSLRSARGRELVAYSPVKRKNAPLPEPVKRPLPPGEIKSNEELYLTGLRLEQLHSPARDPEPYYEEAIRRDPGDYRANTALGILHLKGGRFQKAEERLRKAVERITENYIRPKDGEALYYLGVALRAQNNTEGAEKAFHQAVWCEAWKGAGYFALAELACARGDVPKALELVNRSLANGAWDTRALNLKAALLRRLGRLEQARKIALRSLAIDPLDFPAQNELYLAQSEQGSREDAGQTLKRLEKEMRGEAQSYLEMASDYGNCGLWDEAIDVLKRFADSREDKTKVFPMVYYYLGFYCEKKGLPADAERYGRLASSSSPHYCFPLRFESVEVLEGAKKRNPGDAKAPYYLGNLLYDHQPERAIREWERSIELDGSFALAHRNLALACAYRENDVEKAIPHMERAIALDPGDPRLYYEMDLLHEAAGKDPRKRLDLLSRNHEVVARRDDAVTREIVLHIQLGNGDRAIELLRGRRFHNWEGNRGIHDVYVDALLQRGQERFRAGQYRDALKDYEAALEYPENLEVGRPYHDRREGEIHYFIGTAWQALGNSEKALASFEKALEKVERNPLESQYFQALALKILGREEKAKEVFERILRRGEERLKAAADIDYFAKFGERESERDRQAQGHYLVGLGHLGLGRKAEARAQFEKVLELSPAHLGANSRLASLGTEKNP